jgi:hypothetical protein
VAAKVRSQVGHELLERVVRVTVGGGHVERVEGCSDRLLYCVKLVGGCRRPGRLGFLDRLLVTFPASLDLAVAGGLSRSLARVLSRNLFGGGGFVGLRLGSSIQLLVGVLSGDCVQLSGRDRSGDGRELHDGVTLFVDRFDDRVEISGLRLRD